MHIFYNFNKKILDKIKVDHQLFEYTESENPNLTKYDIFLKLKDNNSYQIIYQKNKIINSNDKDINNFLKIVIELQNALFERDLNQKKYIFEIKNKLIINKENTRLQKKLIYDSKFDCYNFGYFKSQCQKEIEKYRRYLEPFTILLLDIDNFKKINDEYGHDVGDIALEKFIEAIKKNIRTVDMVFRFGGDEFVVLLHKAMMVGSFIVSKRIQDSINKISFMANNVLVKNKIKTSIGIVTVSEEVEENILDVDSLFKKADRALYNAKDSGKNRIIHIEHCKRC